MKVDLFFSRDISEPHAEIHTNELTDNIQQAITLLEDDSKMDMLAVKKGKDISFLNFDEIFMIRVEDKQVNVYTQEDKYLIKKALYQVEESLNPSFVRISKTTIVNIKKIDRVAPSLKGMMFIMLKNGLKDNISRKYLPEFKKALDL
ncbi:LytTR family DNA-binding domain-containing protein [Methanobrevibacter millerae]|uniref:LytTR family transcriptional regulator n=1 Tax=Methanobrevibacter millerae TaxID=230361 RepID=A0A8T3VJR2_9EURY|nr:LytTR family DNA-binding domain-containing protein [Methanobrevibacter millerae]MBE6504404.1 LytTR family transcriptional regulator [Methanobrevibacter millerae]MBQ6345565.1 LytTR family transcriptional regulator [Methanobrevibacter sp.]MBR0059388.1 LytTR family transcriptional regulator [Methanobrevibacter sp.]MBR0370079.1 LytTR family transcriptional regulator [Methanobrevibacter sp.]